MRNTCFNIDAKLTIYRNYANKVVCLMLSLTFSKRSRPNAKFLALKAVEQL